MIGAEALRKLPSPSLSKSLLGTIETSPIRQGNKLLRRRKVGQGIAVAGRQGCGRRLVERRGGRGGQIARVG